jgi:rare lipoprotein A
MTKPVLARAILASILAVALASCGTGRIKDGPPAPGGAAAPPSTNDAIPRPEPRSRYGNGPVYEVFGERYTVLDSSAGYKERGVASWYGKKFHGEMTSMQEPYDMYAMTAAHKTLPLPTYVRVRNLRNDRAVIVRVNDRGPFVDNRIIDLSYAAAIKLDMIQDGTSLVEVEAISFDGPAGDRTVRQSTPPQPDSVPQANSRHAIYVQSGAFSERVNASRQLGALVSGGIGTAFIVEDLSGKTPIYRVRIGPVGNVEQYDLLVAELRQLGIDDTYLVAD